MSVGAGGGEGGSVACNSVTWQERLLFLGRNQMFQICPLSRAPSPPGEAAVPLKTFPETIFKSLVPASDATEPSVCCGTETPDLRRARIRRLEGCVFTSVRCGSAILKTLKASVRTSKPQEKNLLTCCLQQWEVW